MIYVRTGLSGETSRDGYLREYKDEGMAEERRMGKERLRRYINLAAVTASNLAGISLDIMPKKKRTLFDRTKHSFPFIKLFCLLNE